jgi:hypothetical protein
MTMPFAGVIVLFVLEYFFKMFVGSYILNGNSLKVYMLAYNHMEICILFWKVVLSINEKNLLF